MSEFFNIKTNSNISTIELNRNPVNALSFNFLLDLKNAFIELDNDNDIRVIIVKTNLDHFSAGADLKERKIMSKNESGDALDNFNDCFNTIESCSKPVICCIDGFCLGGGAELALSCDIRIGTINSTIGFPEVSIGIIPGAGGTQRLPKVLGVANAKYWIYSAKKFNGKDALEYGFLNFIEDDYESVLLRAQNICDEIIKNAPIAVSVAKKAINEGFNQSLDKALTIERDSYNIALNTQDRDEALSAFIDKRKPIWRNK